ncbi:hypothetical protein [Clostridium lundense]|uniref:hypothetical protein n=1 Tax=Clostridium lundense TaxID=319475 RepID=UPI000481CB8D|nr:hypothetical protein [Clostridium lundense]
MNYYYGILIIQVLICILALIKVINTIVNLKNKKIHKGYWILVIILIPLLIYYIKYHLIEPTKDLKYAIKGKTKVIQGKVEKVYVAGGSNPFILGGKEFRRNPWSFSPKEGEKYILKYLPNSRYVVEYEKISD